MGCCFPALLWFPLHASSQRRLLFAFARNNSGVDVRRAVSGTLADGSLSIRVVPQANVEGKLRSASLALRCCSAIGLLLTTWVF